MSKYCQDEILNTINKIKCKLNMLGLTYEFNRLQFAIMAYANLNQNKLKQDMTIFKAASIVLSFLPDCLKKTKYQLSQQELEILFGFTASCLFDFFKPKQLKKSNKIK